MRARYAEAQQIEKLFRHTWPKAKRYPDVHACYRVAVSLNVVRMARKPRQPAKLAAFKHARLLLRHLPAVRQRWEAAAAETRFIEIDSEGHESEMVIVAATLGHDKVFLGLDLIKQIERDVRAFLELAPLRQPQPNAAAFIAERVKKAWASVEGTKPPLSVRPYDPLCCFVTAALAQFVGKHLSPATVSDILRGRERRPRRSKTPKKTKAATS